MQYKEEMYFARESELVISYRKYPASSMPIGDVYCRIETTELNHAVALNANVNSKLLNICDASGS